MKDYLNEEDTNESVIIDYSHNGQMENDSLNTDIPDPLNIMPSFSYIRPAVFLYIIFIIISLLYWQSPWSNYLWLSRDSFFNSGEYWRCITSIAAHADAVHLLANTLLYFVFGWFLFAYFGFILFPAASLGIGAVAGIMTVLFYSPEIRVIGASGMIYGMVSLWLVFYMRYESNHRPAVRFMRAVGFSLIMMFPTVYNPGTSYLAHANGFVIGIFTGLFLTPLVKPRKSMIQMKTSHSNKIMSE